MPRIAKLLLLLLGLLFTSVAQTAPSDYERQLEEYDRRVAAQAQQQQEAYDRYLAADRETRKTDWMVVGATIVFLIFFVIVISRNSRRRLEEIRRASRENVDRSLQQGERMIQLLTAINDQLARTAPPAQQGIQDPRDGAPPT